MEKYINIIYKGELNNFIKELEKDKIEISIENNAFLKIIYQILEEEYGVLSVKRIKKIKEILDYILEHPKFKLDTSTKEEKNITITIIVANLLLSGGNDKIKEYPSQELYAPLLLTTTILTNNNGILKNLLESMFQSEKTKEQFLKNDEYISKVLEKIIQGRNNEAMNIIMNYFGGKLEFYPFDMLLIATKYSNIEIIKELKPGFEKYDKHEETNLIDLIEIAFLNKNKNTDTIKEIMKMKPIKEVLLKEKKVKKYKERINKLKEYIKEKDIKDLIKEYIY